MQQRYLLNRIEFVFHAGILLLTLGAIVPLWREMTGFTYNQIEGDALMRGILLFGYFMTLPRILLFPTQTLLLIKRSPIVWGLIFFAFLSTLWSFAPAISLRKNIAILLTTLYALVLCMRYPFYHFLRLLGFTFFCVILASLILVIVFPEWGIMQNVHEGAWRGIFTHKNTLGKACAFGLILFTTLWSMNTQSRQRIFWAMIIILDLIILAGSRSVSAVVVAGLIFLIAIFLKLVRPWSKVWPLIFLMTIALGVLLGFFLIQKTDTILDVLGRDVTLTGRTPLWDILIPMGLKKPFGYGFGAFWLGWKGPSAIVWSKVAWMPTMAHNGFIDLWLDIGFPGVILGGLLLIISLLSNFRPALLGSPMELFWVLVILFLLVYNFVETSFLRANHFYWVIMVSAYVSSRYRIPASIKT